jgi:hypothetical protein
MATFDLDPGLLAGMAQPEISKSQWERSREAAPLLIDTLNKRADRNIQTKKIQQDALASAASTQLSIDKASREQAEMRWKMGVRAEEKVSGNIYKGANSFISATNLSDLGKTEEINSVLTEHFDNLTVEHYDALIKQRDEASQRWNDPEVRLNNMLSVTNAIDMKMPEDAARGIERAADFPPNTVINVTRGERSEGRDMLLVEAIGKNGQQVVTPLNLLTFEIQTPQGMTNKFAMQSAATSTRNTITASALANDRRIAAAALLEYNRLRAEARGETLTSIDKDTFTVATNIISMIDENLLEELSDGDDKVKETYATMLVNAAQKYRRTPYNAAQAMTYSTALQYVTAAYKVAIVTKDQNWLETLLGWDGTQVKAAESVDILNGANALIDAVGVSGTPTEGSDNIDTDIDISEEAQKFMNMYENSDPSVNNQ